jgi:murein L,D-transpeptidase YafK
MKDNPEMSVMEKVFFKPPNIIPWGCSILFLCLGIFLLFFNNDQEVKVLPKISRILVEKGQRKMTAYYGDNSFKEYKIALGSQPEGPKLQQGDGKTPEGLYKIIYKNKTSKFHLSLKISYPNENDVKQAISRNVDPGNDIMIHGLCKGLGSIGTIHLMRDWTLGCIAVTNPEIEEIFAATSIGTPVEIRP